MFVSKMLKEHFLDYESHTVTQPPLQQKLEILDRHLGKISTKAKSGSSSQRMQNVPEKRRSPPQQQARPLSAAKPQPTAAHHHANISHNAKQLERTPTQSQGKPPSRSDKAYISQTSRGVSKQIAQALETDNLGKMDAVDILSVLKRIENLEKMAQSKA